MTQQIQTTFDSICFYLSNNISPHVKLIRPWIYREKVAVFDYRISGRQIAFDVKKIQHNVLRVEVFCRDPNEASFLNVVGFDPLESGRFLVKEIYADAAISNIEEEAGKVIAVAAEQIARLGRHPSDLSLLACVSVASPLVIVDVGANDLSEPPYASLRQAGLCKIVGFEPQQQAFEDLQKGKNDNELFFPFAIGAPGTIDLNIYEYSGFTSSYKVDEGTIGIAPQWFAGTRLKQIVSLECVGLDDVPDLPQFDVLKIDIQGGELDVFRHAKRSIASALCIITEVGFFPLYEKAPSFADVHLELLDQGFFLHKFLHQSHVAVSKSHNAQIRDVVGRSQIIDGDAVYLRDYRDMNVLSSEDLKKYCLLGHFLLKSEDFVLRMLNCLVQRKETTQLLVDNYANSLL